MGRRGEIEVSPEARKLVIAYKQCFGTESGKVVMKELESYVQFWEASFTKREGEPSDGKEMAFLEGRKQVYRHIKNIINVDLPAEK